MSTPQSTIYVCSGVRLDSRYQHSIYFESENMQRAYFMGKVVKQFSTYSYIRKSWNIKLHATLEEAYKWNYLFFHNFDDGKWYYYFINNIEYVNDATVELTLEMDVIQTYLFDFALLPCFVERQHSESDEIGEHTIDEGLDLGEMKNAGMYKLDTIDDIESGELVDLTDLCILIMATVNPETGSSVFGSMVHGVYNGIGTYAVSADKWVSFAGILKDLDKDCIINMWMYPKALVKVDEVAAPNGFDDTNRTVHTVTGIKNIELNIKKSYGSTIDGHEVRNNKLFCFPYNFLYLSNNAGASGVFRYERFTNNVCEFRLSGAVSPDATIRLDPLYYNGSPYNYEEGMLLSDFPTCAWDADAYKIWLASNLNQNKLAYGTAGATVAAGAVATVAGLFTGGLASIGGAGMMASGASQIAQLNAQKKDLQLQPPQAKGAYSTNVNVALGIQTFIAYFRSITKETAAVLDDYFDMYGYKLNRVMTPKLLTRKFFTYTKTVGCQITGKNGRGMCNDDMVKIESIFDKGITFWRNGDIVGDYVACQGANLPT